MTGLETPIPSRCHRTWSYWLLVLLLLIACTPGCDRDEAAKKESPQKKRSAPEQQVIADSVSTAVISGGGLGLLGLGVNTRAHSQQPAVIPVVGPAALPDVGLSFEAPNGTLMLASSPWRFAWRDTTVEIVRRPLIVADDLLAVYRERFVERFKSLGFELIDESTPNERPFRFDLRSSDNELIRVLLFPDDEDVIIVQVSGDGAHRSSISAALLNAETFPPFWMAHQDGVRLSGVPVAVSPPDGWMLLPEADSESQSIQLIGPLFDGQPTRRITVRASPPGAPETDQVIEQFRGRMQSDPSSELIEVTRGRFRGVPAVSYEIMTDYPTEQGSIPVRRRGVMLRTADHRILSVDVALPTLEASDTFWNQLINNITLLR